MSVLYPPAASFQFTMSTFFVSEGGDTLVGAISLNTTGQLEQDISVVVQTVSIGTATGTSLMCN